MELLSQVDKLLLNRKKIWATFLLCFSPTRNSMLLFYDTDKSRKVGYMRVNKVLGFLWVSFNFTLAAALRAFPLNFGDYPWLTTNPLSVFLMSGSIFGFSSLYFYTGFSLMFDKLMSIYVRRESFNVLIFVLKVYLTFLFPMCFITAIMVTIFPFLGEGPIYPYIAK